METWRCLKSACSLDPATGFEGLGGRLVPSLDQRVPSWGSVQPRKRPADVLAESLNRRTWARPAVAQHSASAGPGLRAQSCQGPWVPGGILGSGAAGPGSSPQHGPAVRVFGDGETQPSQADPAVARAQRAAQEDKLSV